MSEPALHVVHVVVLMNTMESPNSSQVRAHVSLVERLSSSRSALCNSNSLPFNFSKDFKGGSQAKNGF